MTTAWTRAPLLSLALLLAPAPAAVESNIRVYVDQVQRWDGGGIPYVTLSGWIVGNGFVPEKALYLDGAYVSSLWPQDRPDVCSIVRVGWRWRCGDERDYPCTTYTSANCVGVWQTLAIDTLTPGAHALQLCAAHLERPAGQMVQQCSAFLPFVR